jgi:hypothetical protein
MDQKKWLPLCIRLDISDLTGEPSGLSVANKIGAVLCNKLEIGPGEYVFLGVVREEVMRRGSEYVTAYYSMRTAADPSTDTLAKWAREALNL